PQDQREGEAIESDGPREARVCGGESFVAAASKPAAGAGLPASLPTRCSPKCADHGRGLRAERGCPCRGHLRSGFEARSLVTIQTYTSDRAPVRQAIDDVAPRATGTSEKLRIGPRGFGAPDSCVCPTTGAQSGC